MFSPPPLVAMFKKVLVELRRKSWLAGRGQGPTPPSSRLGLSGKLAVVREFRRESELVFLEDIRSVAAVPPLGCNCSFSNIRSAALDLRTGNLGNAVAVGS